MNGPLLLPTWADLEATSPALVAPMRRYLEQIGCVLRPGSVGGADLALRAFATFLTEQAPEVSTLDQVTLPARGGLQAVAGRPAGTEP